jgi:hypothetical protein
MQATKDYVANHGGDPKAAFFQLCKERGVTPKSIVAQVLGL